MKTIILLFFAAFTCSLTSSGQSKITSILAKLFYNEKKSDAHKDASDHRAVSSLEFGVSGFLCEMRKHH